MRILCSLSIQIWNETISSETTTKNVTKRNKNKIDENDHQPNRKE